MEGGPSTPTLAAAVSNAGGLGFLAGGALSAEELAEAIVGTRRMTTAPIGVNLFVPHSPEVTTDQLRQYAASLSGEVDRYGAAPGRPHHDSYDDWLAKVSVVCDLRPEVVSFTFGAPNARHCCRIRTAGILTLATVTTPQEAAIALSRGVDGLVAQGPSAGGHRATFDPRAMPTDPLEDLVSALIKMSDRPVVAAGGIATAADVRGVRCLGATAAQIGTALLLADEAGTNPVHRAALTDPQFDATVLTRCLTGRYARALRNRFVDDHEPDAIFGFPEVAGITAPVQAAAVRAGDPHGTSLFAGTAFREAMTGPAAHIVHALSL
ncbi:2-nitropropane dioxygenase [Mycolicibacterium agri]|nr:2-nitropropane dioxygenase [Mycolicibacterium agri]